MISGIVTTVVAGVRGCVLVAIIGDWVRPVARRLGGRWLACADAVVLVRLIRVGVPMVVMPRPRLAAIRVGGVLVVRWSGGAVVWWSVEGWPGGLVV